MNEPAANAKWDHGPDDLLALYSAAEWTMCPDVLPHNDRGYTYVFRVSFESCTFPFYAGQTGRLVGRFGDYACAHFKAPTDFRVGEACRYFLELGGKVHLLWRESTARLKDERLLVRELILAGFPLLNSLSAFKYQEANATEERVIVRRFCDMALKSARLRAQG